VKHLWKVMFDAKYTGLGDMIEETVHVVANGDGEIAVRKARRLLVGKRRCRYVKLVGLEQVREIDG
jgi:hypothetical protein